MLSPHLLRHALAFTSIDRILFSSDYPFHKVCIDDQRGFFATLPHDSDRQKIASSNAEKLFRL
jgi:predicted TIM-barrel fold metal-dependent hydrolase